MGLRKKKNKELYTSAIRLMDEKNITSLRKRVKILIIDDETDDIYQVLSDWQYEVYYKSDMTYAIEAEPFDIVLMDIRGVAKRLKSSMEGFALACEIKKKYPLKKVCCYSGSTNEEIAEQLSLKKIDAFFLKDMDIDKIRDKVDTLILDYVDVNKQWEILRKEMLEYQIADEDIQKIREVYFAGFEKGDFWNLNLTLIECIKNSTVMLNITAAIFNLVKVLVI